MDGHTAQPSFPAKLSDELLDHRGSSSAGILSVGQQSFSPIAIPPLGRPVLRHPEQLRLHPALVEVGWTGGIDNLNDAARLKNQSVTEPVLITTSGTILSSFGTWRLAIFESREHIECIEMRSAKTNPFSSYCPAIDHGADGITLCAFAWL